MQKRRLNRAGVVPLERSSWGVFAPSGLVLLTLVGALAISPLFQRQISARWLTIVEVIDPSRVLIGEIQAALAREMAAVRAYALTEDPVFVRRYQDLLATERALFGELRAHVLGLSPEVISAYRDFERRAEEWHLRPTEQEMRAAVLEPMVYAERIPSEQAIWEQLLAASEGLREALIDEEISNRNEIRRLERTRLVVTAALIFLAFAAAAVAAWLGIRIQHLRLEAERRRREIARLTENRANLIRGITHDVKNPLGVISGYAELISDGTLEEASSREALGRIQEASGNALQLIDDLLEVSLAEAGQLRFHWETVDIGRQVEAAVGAHEAAAVSAGLSMNLTISDGVPALRTDARRIRQILGNLLSNAIKYTPKGGVIEVRVGAAGPPDLPAGELRLAIEVTDTGPGIPEEKREEIFEEFSRLEPGAERGTGLGLAISRRIARAMGGDITVGSADGGGSRFTLWLPLQPPARAHRT